MAKNIFEKASYLIHRSFDNTIRPEKLRYAYDTGIPYFSKWDNDNIIKYNKELKVNRHDALNYFLDRKYLKNSSINAYLKDIYILMSKFALIIDYDPSSEKHDPSPFSYKSLKAIKTQIIHPYISNNSNFTRIFELLLTGRMNFKMLEKSHVLYKGEETFKNGLEEVLIIALIIKSRAKEKKQEKNLEKLSNIAELKSIISKLDLKIEPDDDTLSKVKDIMSNTDIDIEEINDILLDSIYAYNKIIEIVNIFGNSFLIFHTMIGMAHKKLGDWLRFYKQFIRIQDDCDSLGEQYIKELTDLLGEKGGIFHIDSSYQYEQAREQFYLALQTHNEGEEYQRLINDLYYLEDDFNDDLMHFFVSRERFAINTGIVRKQLEEIKFWLDNSETHKFNNFYEKFTPTIN